MVDARPAMDWLKPRFQTAGLWLLSHSLDFARGIFQLVISVLIAFFLYRDGVGLVQRMREGFEERSGDMPRDAFVDGFRSGIPEIGDIAFDLPNDSLVDFFRRALAHPRRSFRNHVNSPSAVMVSKGYLF